MERLTIRWQRIVDENDATCLRCSNTEKEIDQAADALSQVLALLEIEVSVEKNIVNKEEFLSDPLESNRIWVAGKPLEDWLKGTTGQSPCPCTICSNRECRKITVSSETYEVISAGLIVKASLMAALQISG